MAEITQLQRQGLYELTDSARAQLADSKYYNEDLAPTSFAERTWNTYHISMLWVGMAICIPSITMASSLVAQGLAPWLAVLNVILGNAIILIPIQLNSHAGTKYGIPFPVFSRLTFGIRGSHIPTLSRAVTACGWNMVQSMTGAAALLFIAMAVAPAVRDRLFPIADTLLNASTQGLTPSDTAIAILVFVIFLAISGILTASGSKVIRIFESIGSPILVIMVAGLFIWAAVIGNGAGYSVGDIFTSNIPGGTMPDRGPVYLFLLGLTGNIAFWATMALNIPDFSRYAKSQKTQFRGQMYGMLPGMAFCAIVGAFFAQATQLAYETTIWNPVGVLGVIWSDSAPVYVLTFVLGIGIVIATLTTNIAANIVAPANGFSNLAPKKISYKLGTLIACLVAAAYLVPFTLSTNFVGFMWTFMNVYGGFLAPLASIFILDYYFIKKRNIDIASLFKLNGRYYYKGGFNVQAIVAWVGGAILPTLISLIPALQGVTALSWINANAYLFAFFVSLIIYALIMPRNHESVLSDEEERAITEVVA